MLPHMTSLHGNSGPRSVRENLGLRRDDTVDDGDLTAEEMLDEAAARLSAVRAATKEGSDLNCESVEFVTAVLGAACAQLRARQDKAQDADEDENGEDDRRGDYLSEGEGRQRNRVEHVDLDEAQMAQRRRCILPGASGLVVDHAARRR